MGRFAQSKKLFSEGYFLVGGEWNVVVKRWRGEKQSWPLSFLSFSLALTSKTNKKYFAPRPISIVPLGTQ